MTKIAKITKQTLPQIAEQMESELAALAEKLGLKISYGGGKYDAAGNEGTINITVKIDDPEVQREAARLIWNNNCRLIGIDYTDTENSGLRPEDFGTEFKYGQATYETTGIATRGRGSQKYPILVKVINDPKGKHASGTALMLPDTAVPLIRMATDAAQATKAA
ncbi:MAG: hypothetical protein Tp170SUR191951_76 [Prokaryotic dsDNA virus sp.]|nr:hypothetical protein [Pseudomonas sp.]MBS67371.1 hypothetical protein [Pseudomonas sp.]QDP55238.1 MAG: hypothetical protein Tp170SUR191951_76 [Prokaryotic dsDNA virus sp.]